MSGGVNLKSRGGVNLKSRGGVNLKSRRGCEFEEQRGGVNFYCSGGGTSTNCRHGARY